jgi:hypothetical protein
MMVGRESWVVEVEGEVRDIDQGEVSSIEGVSGVSVSSSSPERDRLAVGATAESIGDNISLALDVLDLLVVFCYGIEPSGLTLR